MPASRDVKEGTVLYWTDGARICWGVAPQALRDCTVLLTDGRVVDPLKCDSRLESAITKVRKHIRREKHG